MDETTILALRDAWGDKCIEVMEDYCRVQGEYIKELSEALRSIDIDSPNPCSLPECQAARRCVC